MISNILLSSDLFEIYILILSHGSTHIRFAPPIQRPTSRYFQQFPNIFQTLCLFLVFFYIKNNIYIINLMYFNNCYGLKHLTFLLFIRNISRWVSFWMNLGSCCARLVVWSHGKCRNSYLGWICQNLVHTCSDFAFYQVDLTLHVNALTISLQSFFSPNCILSNTCIILCSIHLPQWVVCVSLYSSTGIAIVCFPALIITSLDHLLQWRICWSEAAGNQRGKGRRWVE